MKPSGCLSRGRQAGDGSSLRCESARIAANPPMPMGGMAASVPPQIITSASPRRKELLGLLGLVPEVLPTHIEETRAAGESPVRYVERLALEKAMAAAARRPDALVVAADTTVAMGDAILEQPADRADSVRMLDRVRG